MEYHMLIYLFVKVVCLENRRLLVFLEVAELLKLEI
jgi:hypothetical protein